MTNTDSPFRAFLTDGDTDKLIREALETPAELDFPHLTGSATGVSGLDVSEVHVVATSWIETDAGAEATALCGADLHAQALGLFSVRPMCWLCADVLNAKTG